MYKIYNVKSNENIDEIANKLSSTSDAIRKINNLKSDYQVNYGDQIVVPVVRNQLFDTYTVIKGDTLYSIAQKYDVTVNNLALLNGLDVEDYLYPGQEIMVPESDVKFHIVQSGDTLESAAKNFKITIADLLSQNPVIYLSEDQLLVYKKEK